jgi:hypothetical protein
MRRTRLALLAALAAAGSALAQEPPRETPLDLEVGERKSLCPCPVSQLICDDPSLVRLVEGSAGQSLEGVKAGTTLCSLQGPNRIKRTYRVTVTKPDAGDKGEARKKE